MGYFGQSLNGVMARPTAHSPQFMDISQALANAEANDPLRLALGTIGDAIEDKKEEFEQAQKSGLFSMFTGGI